MNNFFEEIVPQMGPREFRRYFWMNRHTLDVIVNKIQDNPVFDHQNNCLTPINKKVAMLCCYLGSNFSTLQWVTFILITFHITIIYFVKCNFAISYIFAFFFCRLAHIFGISEQRFLFFTDQVIEALMDIMDNILCFSDTIWKQNQYYICL